MKQPFAIAVADRSPFGLAGLWENWKDPATGEWVRTFGVITTNANELVAEIHDRMPAILRLRITTNSSGRSPTLASCFGLSHPSS
jgi:putative SOS response-associated peptidase YedK